MARLKLPTDRPVQSGARISQGAAQAPGLAQASVAREVQAMNKEFFNQAKEANQSTEYNRAMTSATESFAKQSQARYQQVTDDKGNPTFTTLPQDIGTIGDKVRQEALKNVFDPEVRTRFSNEFSRFSSNQQIASLSKARSQQLDFSRAELNTSLESYKRQAVQVNPEQLGDYEGQARQALDSALHSGFISAQEHGNLDREFTSTVRTESYRNLIEQSPEAALKEISSASPESLGLAPKEKDRLVKEASAAVRDKQVIAEHARKAEQEVVKSHKALTKSRLDLGMQKGEVGEAEILQHLDLLGEIETNKLLIKLDKSRARVTKSDTTATAISAAKKEGGSLISFTPSQIETHFQNALELVKDPESPKVPSLSQKAEVAIGYNAPVKSIQKELSHAAQFGDDESVQEAVQSYEFMKEQNPASVKINPALEAIAEMVENTPVPIKEIIEDVRDRVYKRDNKARQEASANFRKLKNKGGDASLPEINNMISDLFDDRFFGGEYPNSPGMSLTVQRMYEEAYIDTGSSSNAKKMVQSQLKAKAGTTRINGKETNMFNPPEKVFPQFTTEQLEGNLRSLVKEANPSIDAKDVQVQSYSGTRGTFNRETGQEIIKYVVFTEDEFGQQVPVTTPEGEPVLWVVDPKEVIGEAVETFEADKVAKEKEQLDELKRKRKHAQLPFKRRGSRNIVGEE